jgi:hypothetical protein
LLVSHSNPISKAGASESQGVRTSGTGDGDGSGLDVDRDYSRDSMSVIAYFVVCLPVHNHFLILSHLTGSPFSSQNSEKRYVRRTSLRDLYGLLAVNVTHLDVGSSGGGK